MSQKTRYCKLFNSIKDKKLNDETIKVFQYFDKNEWVIEWVDGTFVLASSGILMSILAIQEKGNLDAILAKTKETLTPYLPSNIDFNQVDWYWLGLNYLHAEIFNRFED